MFHGTTDVFAERIVSGGVRVALGQPNRDFGRGFYTTTAEHQAHVWAARVATLWPDASPAVVRLSVPREALAELRTLAFVRGDFHADEYWSFVHHCRKGAPDHGYRLAHYDVVFGPVAAYWYQKMLMADCDQVSFHTLAAESLLNASSRKRII